MTIFLGEEKLRKDTAQPQNPCAEKIAENVYALKYYGSSNATIVIGKTGCILIDAFEKDWCAEDAKKEIEKITQKPVKTIIFTHLHADHIGGAGIFKDTVEQVIAHVPNGAVLQRQEMYADESLRRMIHQFGMTLSIEESLSMGLNPSVEAKGEATVLPVTEYISEQMEEMVIDGIRIQFIAAPGETDDTQFIYLPELKVVCCGDDYYASWPNLYALRGSQYRDVTTWVDSLGKLMALDAEWLLPGHGETIHGKDDIQEILGNYRDAIDWVVNETLKGIGKGKTPDELAKEISLPEQWKELRYLQEYYGTVEWSVRGIYAGYMGWFDGNPTHIGALKKHDKAARSLAMMGGEAAVEAEIQLALQKETMDDMQWALELCDILLDAECSAEKATKWKAEACIFLGRMQTSANGRHYYLSCAKSLMK